MWKEDLILHLSGCNNFFENTSGMREWRHWNFPSLISPAAISNIYAQFVPVGRGLDSAYFKYKQLFESTSGMREWRH